MGTPQQRSGRAGVSLAASLALLLVACSGGDAAPGNAAPSSSTAAPAADSTAPTTTSTAPACPGTETLPPAGARDVTEVEADVDLDGAADRVLSYRRSDGSGRVAVELAAGGSAAVDAGAAGAIEGPAPLSILGGAELGGDGETVFVVTGAGASVVVIGLFQLVDCTLTPVTFPSGQTVELPVGGGITHADGITCTDGDDGVRLVRRSATSTDGESFTATGTGYRVEGSTLVEVRSETHSLDLAEDASQLDQYPTLDCPDLERGLGG